MVWRKHPYQRAVSSKSILNRSGPRMEPWETPVIISVQSLNDISVYPASLSCVAHSIDLCNVTIKSIRNMHAVANQIADILHFNEKGLYG